MNTNMNTLVCNIHYYKVLQLETRTENPCVGGSIPPLGTIKIAFHKPFIVNNTRTYICSINRLIKVLYIMYY